MATSNELQSMATFPEDFLHVDMQTRTEAHPNTSIMQHTLNKL